jgi:hypothetical protein
VLQNHCRLQRLPNASRPGNEFLSKLLSSRLPWQDREFLAVGKAVGQEVGVVDGKDDAKVFAGGEVDEGGVGEIHGTVSVLGHKSLNLRQFFVGNDGHPDCPGTQERPNGAVVVEIAPDKIKGLGEDGLGGQPR